MAAPLMEDWKVPNTVVEIEVSRARSSSGFEPISVDFVRRGYAVTSNICRLNMHIMVCLSLAASPGMWTKSSVIFQSSRSTLLSCYVEC